VAAAIGQSVNIPIIVRTLGHELYHSRMVLNNGFKLGLDLLGYLDGNLSGYGRDEPQLFKNYSEWFGRSLLCPAVSDRNWLELVGFRSEILDHRIGQTVGNFSNFSNRIPIGTSRTDRFYWFQVQSIPTGTKWNRSEPVRKSQTSAYIVGDHLIIF